jgi:hypothetical protein
MLVVLSAAALAAPLYYAPDIVPYMRGDTTALVLNHGLLQSMLQHDAAVSTFGLTLKAAPAGFAVASGETAMGSLSRWQVAAMAAGGAPASGTAWFAGVNYAHLITGGFPNVLAGAGGGDPQKIVSAGGGSAVLFAGMAHRGVAVEVGVFFNGYGYEQDAYGRFGLSCDVAVGCEEPLREGSPYDATGSESVDVTRRSFLLNAEHVGGHSAGLLLAPGASGTRLDVLRLGSEPRGLLPEAVGLLGAGLNSYSPEVDVYGDTVSRDAAAREAGEDPEADGKRIYEVPLLGDALGGTGVLARVTLQLAPTPLFRLAEVGWVDGWSVGATQIEAGAQARVFRRGDGMVPGADAFARVTRASSKHEGAGQSFALTWSYNSPDPLNFPPVRDAQVLGVHFLTGNPDALPPPVPYAAEVL